MQNAQLLVIHDSFIQYSLTELTDSNKYIKKAHGREYYVHRKQIQWFLKKKTPITNVLILLYLSGLSILNTRSSWQVMQKYKPIQKIL